MTAVNLPEQVYERTGAAVAVLSDSAGLDAGDILIPRLKLAQMISGVVAKELVPYGAIYVMQSRDDMEPEILAGPGKQSELGPAVRFYVHGDPRKGWSWNRPDKSLGSGPEYPDLRDVREGDVRNVRRTYDYLVTLPGYPMLPVRFLMHGQWGGQAAKQLNTNILLMRQKGVVTSTIAFKLQARKTTSPKDGQDRPFVQAIIGVDKVPAKDHAKDLELVSDHIDLVSGTNVSEVADHEPADARPVATDAPSLD